MASQKLCVITRITLPACRAHYPGGPERVLSSVASPSRAAFPVTQAGRRPRLHFRGLLRLHSRYGPLDRSTAQGGLCRKASAWPVAPAKPLASYQITPARQGLREINRHRRGVDHNRQCQTDLKTIDESAKQLMRLRFRALRHDGSRDRGLTLSRLHAKNPSGHTRSPHRRQPEPATKRIVCRCPCIGRFLGCGVRS